MACSFVHSLQFDIWPRYMFGIFLFSIKDHMNSSNMHD